MHTLKSAIFFVLCACGAPKVEHAAPLDHAIQLRRPSHVGDRWHVVTDATIDETRTTYTEQVLVKKDEKHRRLHFDAEAKALAVDAYGDVTREDLSIASFTDGARSIVDRGKHIVIELAQKKADSVVEIDGVAATSDMRELVDDVTAISHGAGDPDTFLGTRDRQPVGGSWPFDKEAMRIELARAGVNAKTSAIEGRVTLANVARDANVDCLDVRIDIDISAFEPAAPLPEGSTITKGKVSVRIDELLPIDARLSRKGDDLVVHAEFEAFIPVKGNVEVAGVTIESKTDHTRHARYEKLE